MTKYAEFDNFGIEAMNKEQYHAAQQSVLDRCRCTKCPTFVAGDELAGFCFPAIGTSDVIHKEKNCVCPTCEVYKEYELSHNFYCTRCSQFCQEMKVNVSMGP